MRRETNTSEGHAKWQKSLDFIKKKTCTNLTQPLN
jgi:hypothetical protein